MSDVTSVLAGAQMTAADLLPGAGNGQGGGQNVALFNHNSGIFGASGNPDASAGPGFFFRDGEVVSSQVHFVQQL